MLYWLVVIRLLTHSLVSARDLEIVLHANWPSKQLHLLYVYTIGPCYRPTSQAPLGTKLMLHAVLQCMAPKIQV